MKYTAQNLMPNAQNVNNLTSAREIVRWAYSNKPGAVSQPFDVDGNYVIALLKNVREKGTAAPKDVKDEVTYKIRNEKKAEQIIAKLGTVNSLDDAAKKYGTQALVYTADNFTLASASIPNLGYDPAAAVKHSD